MRERRDVTRSKQLIKQAYFALLFRKEHQKITVNDILEEANVSRGTFYSHYQDILALQEQLKNDIVSACKKTLKQKSLEEIIKDPYAQVKTFVDTFEVHKKEICALVMHPGSTDITTKFKHLIIKGLMDSGYFLPDPNISLLLYSCIAGALVDCYIDWIVKDCPVDKETLIHTICDFLSGGILNLYNKCSNK